jgi:hypothetical protein
VFFLVARAWQSSPVKLFLNYRKFIEALQMIKKNIQHVKIRHPNVVVDPVYPWASF